MQLLLDDGLDIAAQNIYGYISLHLAAVLRKLGVVRLLLNSEADATA